MKTYLEIQYNPIFTFSVNEGAKSSYAFLIFGQQRQIRPEQTGKKANGKGSVKLN